jgi:hypothetical protein
MSKNATKLKNLGANGIKPIKKVTPTVLFYQTKREGFLVRVFAQSGAIVVNIHLWTDKYLSNTISTQHLMTKNLSEIIDECWKEAKEYLEPTPGR